MKLFLYSLALSTDQARELSSLVGKDPEDITFALIENAADVVSNAHDWLGGFRDMLRINGFQLDVIDLRRWQGQREGLREKLSGKDVIWLGGGNTFYLRWILRKTGADEIIRECVNNGKVYAGWSAGAVIAGPTLEYFDTMDDTEESPEVIWEGLNLTDIVVVPHLDNKEFAEDAFIANEQLQAAGYHTIFIGDHQVFVVNGDERKIV
jgi:dipeptidase E